MLKRKKKVMVERNVLFTFFPQVPDPFLRMGHNLNGFEMTVFEEKSPIWR